MDTPITMEEFFAQKPRYASKIEAVSPRYIYTEYKRHVPLCRIVSDLLSTSLPTPSEELMMKRVSIDIGAYINDNLIVVVNRLDIALRTEGLSLIKKLKDAIWDLYFDTILHPFSEDYYFEGPNYQRLSALESFSITLVRHVRLIIDNNDSIVCHSPHIHPFLNILICFAQTIFQSRPHVVPPNLLLRGSLWQTYLSMWGLKQCYQ